MNPEELKLIEDAAGIIIPWVIQKLFEKQIINAEQKLLAEGGVDIADLLGELKTAGVYPTDKNATFEEREPASSNINRESITG